MRHSTEKYGRLELDKFGRGSTNIWKAKQNLGQKCEFILRIAQRLIISYIALFYLSKSQQTRWNIIGICEISRFSLNWSNFLFQTYCIFAFFSPNSERGCIWNPLHDSDDYPSGLVYSNMHYTFRRRWDEDFQWLEDTITLDMKRPGLWSKPKISELSEIRFTKRRILN